MMSKKKEIIYVSMKCPAIHYVLRARTMLFEKGFNMIEFHALGPATSRAIDASQMLVNYYAKDECEISGRPEIGTFDKTDKIHLSFIRIKIVRVERIGQTQLLEQ